MSPSKFGGIPVEQGGSKFGGIKVNPEGITDEDLQRAERFKQAGIDIRSQQDPFAKQAKEAGVGEAFAASMGKGLTGLGRGLGIVDEPGELEKKAFGALEEEYPTVTAAGEIAGETLPFMVVGGGLTQIPKLSAQLSKSLLKRMALTGTLGAAETGLAAKGRGEELGDVATSAGVGGAVGAAAEAVLPPVLRFGGRMIRKLPGIGAKGALISRSGQASDELLDVLEAEGRKFEDLVPEEVELLKGYGGADATQAERAAFMQSRGMTGERAPTKAQITRTLDDFAKQEEVARKSSMVTGRLENQNSLMIDRWKEPIENLQSGPRTSGSAPYDAVKNRITELDNRVKDMYEVAEETTKLGRSVESKPLEKVLDRFKWDDAPVVRVIRNRAKQMGILDKKGKAVEKMTVAQADQLAKAVNARFGSNSNANRIGRHLKDSIDDAVLKTGDPTDTMFVKARRAKAEVHKAMKRSNSSPYAKRKTSLILDMLEEKIVGPDLLKKGILGGKYQKNEIEDLRKFLHTGTMDQKKAGASAWKELKVEALEYLKNESLAGRIDASGNDIMKRSKFQAAKKRFGNKLDVIFSAEERQFLKDTERLLQLQEAPPGARPSTKTMKALAGKVGNFIKSKPIIGAVFDVDWMRGSGVLKAKPSRQFIPGPVGSPMVGQGVGLTGASMAEGE